MSSKLIVKTIPIIRMDCPTCIPVLEREIKQLEGVDNVRGNYMAKTLKVTYDPDRVQLTEIEAAIERVGYRIAYKRYPSVISRLRGIFQKRESDIFPSISDADFPGKVLHASKTVGVLFSSQTCPTCRIFKLQLQKIGEEVEEKADLYEMDIASTETWRDYDLLSIPTVLIFRDGEVSERFTALPSIEEIKGALKT